jgi:ABC-type uncharacterized transport system permease subunit
LLAAELYEHVAGETSVQEIFYPALFVGLMVLTGLATALVSFLKKRGFFSEIKTV